jgi:hypothetical protein
MRVLRGVPSLREDRCARGVLAALEAAREKGRRIVHYSIQRDHFHFLVEADDRRELSTVARGTAIRIARRVNAALGRKGRFFAERYHARAVTSPTTVRAALVYVMQNWKKHERFARGLDPLSSGPAFDGWARDPLFDRAAPRPVTPPRTWLAREGWRLAGGAIDPAERPGGAATFDGFD